MNTRQTKQNRITKTKLAGQLGVSRSSLYYTHKKPQADELLKQQIQKILETPGKEAYGHKRIAMDLKINKKRVLRVMKKFSIKPTRGKRYKFVKQNDINRQLSCYTNQISSFCPIAPNIVWAGDFTYIKYKNSFIFLAGIEDIFTREIVGFNISARHNTSLVLDAFNNALNATCPATPIFTHCDRGSEYDSYEYIAFVQSFGIKISMSDKASPWQNGHKESFFSHFKDEFGDVNRFDTLGELVVEIQYRIYLYNTVRIHTAIKMPPTKFRKKWFEKNQKVSMFSGELVSKKLGT